MRKTTPSYFVFLSVVLAFMLLCGIASAQTDKTLTTSANPPEGGTVTGGGTYPHNTLVNVQAIPNGGYQFTGWSGALTGTTNPTEIRVNQDLAVTANFALITADGSVSVTILPAGAVSAGAQWQLDGGAPQNSGATVSASAGSHTVSFTTVAGWTTPGSQTVSVATGTTTYATGAYYVISPADCNAVGACNRDWTTTGPVGWAFQTAVNHDGKNCFQSGAILDNEYSSVSTTITGPTSVVFWWKVSSEAAADRLIFFIDGSEADSISGEVDWSQPVINIAAAGLHTLTWSYIKNGSVASGSDAGWLDQFSVVESVNPTGSITINSGAANTNSTAVSLGLTYDDGDGSGVVSMRFSNDGATWSAWETPAATKNWTLDAADGYKTVRLQLLDKAGNKATFTDYILLDKTGPTGTITINNGDLTTSSADVTLGLTWADAGVGATQMRFSTDGATWTAWEALSATRSITLPGPLGYNTVRVQFMDRLGNRSATYSDYIKLIAP